MSFYTSLSGLKGAQSMLSTVSNNIANVATTGFKRSATEFGDIISASPMQSSAIAGQGTRLRGITQQFTQGGFESSERALDLAIGGQGFFVTRSDLTGGSTAFTRAGAFLVDAERFVVDGQGSHLQVFPVDGSGTVVATGGCFDLLHPGHVHLLEQARSWCDRLVVGVNADSSVKRLKGPTRPIQPEAARAAVLASLSTVDLVTVFDEDTPVELIRLLRPDVLVKGADYTVAQVVGGELVQEWGGVVKLAELLPGNSTTATVARMRG